MTFPAAPKRYTDHHSQDPGDSGERTGGSTSATARVSTTPPWFAARAAGLIGFERSRRERVCYGVAEATSTRHRPSPSSDSVVCTGKKRAMTSALVRVCRVGSTVR